MHDLEITWPEGQARFSPDSSPVMVGRSPDAAVILTDPSVSRRHIEFVWTGTAWTASDSSTHGSFDPIGVRLAPTWTVGTDTTVRLGGVEGVELRIELVTTRPAAMNEPLRPVAPPVEIEPPSAPPSLSDFAPPQDRSLPSVSASVAPPAPPAASPAPIVPTPPAPPAAPPPAPPIHRAEPAPDPGWTEIAPAPGPAQFPPPGHDPSGFQAPAADVPPPAAPIEQAPTPPPPPAGFDQGPTPPPPPPAGFDPPPAGFNSPPPAYDAPAPAAYDPPGWDVPPAPAEALPAPGGGLWSPGQDPAATSLHHLASSTQVSDATISLSIENRDFTFLPGTEITIGRDPNCLVTVDERHSLVSRRHLTITHHDDHWWMEDTSTKGTFVDGRRISGPVKAEGAFLAQLGDDDAGIALRVITKGEHHVRRQANLPLLVAIAILALVAVGALILALQNRGGDAVQATSGGGDTPIVTLSAQASPDQAAADLARAKQATVMLLAETPEGLAYGSGFLVSDNLIVTNQHVAALATSLLVAVSRDADQPARVEYEAETVALHPFLDVAVLKLSRDADGNSVASADLSPVAIGDSATLTLGDAVYNTGFPSTLSLISADDMGDLLLPPVSATRGEAASWSIWPGCSNPDQASFIPAGSPPGVGCSPDGDIGNAVVLTTFASGQGASGSPVFQGDHVVAVVFAGPQDEANAGRNITSSAFGPWLTDIIAANS